MLQNDELFKKLTGCTDELLGGGDYEIYQSTYEKLCHEIKQSLKPTQPSQPVAASSTTSSTAAPMSDDTMFEYKVSELPTA